MDSSKSGRHAHSVTEKDAHGPANVTDHLDPESRSQLMARVGDKDTKPEMLVRSLLHRMGYRFRLHRSDLPGKPDIVLPRHGVAVQVHGCFWHRHDCPRGRVLPKTRAQWWRAKLERNRERDFEQQRELERLGWDVLVIWECETRAPEAVAERLHGFLSARRKSAQRTK